MTGGTVLMLSTSSPTQTEALGRALAGLLRPGAVVALRGDLAAGKTCLVRGMASAFDAPESVSSPTFTIVNQYGGSRSLFHLDLYRLSTLDEIMDLGYEELFEPEGICVVEWAERAQELLPAARVEVLLEHGGGDQRTITVTDYGVLPAGWMEILKAAPARGA